VEPSASESAALSAAAAASSNKKADPPIRLKPRRIVVSNSKLDRVKEQENEDEASGGLSALPLGWVSRVSKTHNRIFYFHSDFGSSWIRPSSHVVKRVIADKRSAFKNRDGQSVSSLSHESFDDTEKEDEEEDEEETMEVVVVTKVNAKPTTKPKPKPKPKPKSKPAPKLSAISSRPSVPSTLKRPPPRTSPTRPKRRRILKKPSPRSSSDNDGDGTFDFGSFGDGDVGEVEFLGMEGKEGRWERKERSKRKQGKKTSATATGTKDASRPPPGLKSGPSGGVFGSLPPHLGAATPSNMISQYHRMVASKRLQEGKMRFECAPMQTLLHPQIGWHRNLYNGESVKGCALQMLVVTEGRMKR